MVRVHTGQVERGWTLAEAHCVTALCCAALHFCSGEKWIPQRQNRERYQPSSVLAAAPLLNHPVVVGLDAGESELLVCRLEKRLATEPRKGREAEGRFDVVRL